jgi:threonine dehydrogenase-like Zn-dependent dehydrogenase
LRCRHSSINGENDGIDGTRHRLPERLSMAKAGGAVTINFEQESVVERLNELTGGKGPEKCIDAVGMEAHATGSIDSMYDRAKQAMMLETDRPHVLREMMYVCRPAVILSIPGVYGGLLDKIPLGAVMNKGAAKLMSTGGPMICSTGW